MGREDIAALIEVLQHENELGTDSHVLGSWSISFDKKKGTFLFDKCEADGYCEERPSVIALDGKILDAGGPLLG